MPQPSSPRTCRFTIARVVIAVVAILLAHDAAMAANPHSSAASSESHSARHAQPEGHEHAVMQCGPTDGAVQPQVLLPGMPPAALFTTGAWGQLPTGSAAVTTAQPPTTDASTLRAWLQVYRN